MVAAVVVDFGLKACEARDRFDARLFRKTLRDLSARQGILHIDPGKNFLLH
jgi:hypothetical protein